MSSEKLHITRQNYEEYFLLYVDNELSSAERMAVEAFVASHPDLREELDLLQHTTLDVEPAKLGDTSFLMAENMKMSEADESLLLYLDNELDGKERTHVEKLLKNNPEYQLQYNLLLKTRLEKEKMVYPYKAELYKKTESNRRIYWMRIAAAVIVVAALGLVFLLNGDAGNPGDQPLVADVKPAEKTEEQPDEQQVAVAPAKENVIIQDAAVPDVKVEKKKTNVTAQPFEQQPQQQIAYEEPAPVQKQEDAVAVNTNPVLPVITAGDPQQIINTEGVTTPTANPYTSIENPNATSPADYAVVENQKNGSVRGLLRKATRFIEKRTGVNPVNEDDELLIGAIAIKLK